MISCRNVVSHRARLQRRVDRLSRMPPEIIQYIFDLAYTASCESEDMREPWDFEQSSAGPPSRFLRPFFNRSYYYGIGLDGRAMVERFCDRVPASSLAFVHSLAITGDDSRGWPPFEDTSVARMLSQTPHLESLTIYQYEALASLVLSPLVATFAFRHLRRLKLTCMCPDGVDPFDPRLYTALSLYPSLRHFELDIVGSPDPAEFPSRAQPSPHYSFALLEHIQLSGPLSASPSAVALISSASRVSTLRLEEVEEGRVSSYQLLSALPHPERLENFEYVCESGFSRCPPLPNISISRFTNLASFYIGVDTHFGDPAFFRDLGKLRLLRTPEFSKVTTVNLSDLSASVDVVELDTLSVWIREPATTSLDSPEVFGIRSRAEALERPVQLVEARWPPRFAKEDFRIFAAKCESKGIQLMGNAIGSLKMEDEFHSGATERWRLAHLERAGKERAGEEAEGEQL